MTCGVKVRRESEIQHSEDFEGGMSGANLKSSTLRIFEGDQVRILIYSQSSTAYNLLRNFFILPHKRYLQYLSANMTITPDNDITNEHYLINISCNLTNREKVVIY